MADSPDRGSSKPPERDWSPAGGPAWLLDRQRSLLHQDGEDASAGKRTTGIASCLIGLGLLVVASVVMALVLLLLKSLF